MFFMIKFSGKSWWYINSNNTCITDLGFSFWHNRRDQTSIGGYCYTHINTVIPANVKSCCIWCCLITPKGINGHWTPIPWQLLTSMQNLVFRWWDSFISILLPSNRGCQKLVYRLIVMFLSTEIFSKRRKIYAWNWRETRVDHCQTQILTPISWYNYQRGANAVNLVFNKNSYVVDRQI